MRLICGSIRDSKRLEIDKIYVPTTTTYDCARRAPYSSRYSCRGCKRVIYHINIRGSNNSYAYCRFVVLED